MNATNIHDLCEANLAINHGFDGVRFVDDLLQIVLEAGEIKCTLASNAALRFEVPGEPACEVKLERAKAKLQLLCARLAVLCRKNDEQLPLYGGEGIVAMPQATFNVRFKNTSSEQEFVIDIGGVDA